ncbi:hypothetical protein [Streptomyces sp. NRRL WC-3742]|uniref:hypothetical protein n=1 Tax=Streptomyces sp. NRRL WC-3742 TaxID=1463934 RepID=UPI00131D978D|nr:hypothetical protein [Streptomyces sp. NRRL WC-3742]
MTEQTSADQTSVDHASAEQASAGQPGDGTTEPAEPIADPEEPEVVLHSAEDDGERPWCIGDMSA